MDFKICSDTTNFAEAECTIELFYEIEIIHMSCHIEKNHSSIRCIIYMIITKNHPRNQLICLPRNRCLDHMNQKVMRESPQYLLILATA